MLHCGRSWCLPFIFALIAQAIGGTEDNEVASQYERNSWSKKWRLPQHFHHPSAPKDSPSPPSWSKAYISEGILHLPYAEIDEDFYAWVDLDSGKSRIDFYGGMMKTYQLANEGPYGSAKKIAPMTTETVKNQLNCFQTSGSAEEPVEAQGVLPDISDFKLIGIEVMNGQSCEKWEYISTVGDKTNRYTMWLQHQFAGTRQQITVPVRYEMKGYNSLLGSHYDHYYLDYTSFTAEKPNEDAFMIDSEVGECHGFPGPGVDHIYTFNPMREFAHDHTKHVDDTFDSFIRHHKKGYKNATEQEQRKDIFRQNMRFIHSKNRAGLTYKLAPNHMADRSSDEIKYMRGKLHSTGYNGGSSFHYTKTDVENLPDQMDWRLYGAVTPVKDQSVCGSCWSFGTVGTIEGALFLKTGKLTPLSQQALVDCSWGFGNNGCDGGEDFRVYQWMMKHGGIPSDESYGPYLGADGYCHIDNSSLVASIKGYVNVTSGDIDALRVAIFKHGPISVAIDAAHRAFSFYANGVYYNPECGSGEDSLDHAVLAVGYGILKGEPYWLIKNSWSTYWGNAGYVLMSQKDNNCGVATSPTYVIM